MNGSEMGQSEIPVIMGFWLRRSIDGSAEPLWNWLSQMLKNYDRGFSNTLEEDVMTLFQESEESNEGSDEGGEGDGSDDAGEYTGEHEVPDEESDN